MLNWNYAMLSRMAKAAGGPEKLVETIVKSSVSKGRRSMIPWVLLAAAGGSAGTYFGMRAVDRRRSRRIRENEEAVKAGTELVRGIREYDAAHSGESDVDEETVSRPENNNPDIPVVEEEETDE